MNGRTEISLSRLFVGEGFMAVDTMESTSRIQVFADSLSRGCRCPMCGEFTDKCVGTYTRTLQDIPRNHKRVDLVLDTRKYLCQNEKCEIRTFAEPISFAGRNAVRTDQFDMFALSISTYASAEGTSRIIGCMGGDITGKTILGIQDRVIFPDDSEELVIGVDDFSVDKGQRYATGIYSAKDHRIIAVLDGRDGTTLREWLQKHPGIEHITRDRASAYSKAIDETLPECLQSADRFHLYKNITDTIYDVFKFELPRRLFFKDGKLVDEEPKKITVPTFSPDNPAVKNLEYDNSPVLDKEGKPMEILPGQPELSQAAITFNNKAQKLEIIESLQEARKEKGKINYSAYAATLNLSPATVKKYATLPEKDVLELRTQVQAAKQAAREREMRTPSTFNPIIYRGLAGELDPAMVSALVYREGYCGCRATLENQICGVGREMLGLNIQPGFSTKQVYPPEFEYVNRFDILKYITIKDKSKMENSSVAKYFADLTEEFPRIGEANQTYKQFDTLVKEHSQERLDDFIRAHNVEGDLFRGFARGLELDYDAVLNGITYDLNSGFVEGNNCAIKGIQRTMAGRYSIEHLEVRVKLYSCSTHGISVKALYQRSPGRAYGPVKNAA